MPARLVLPKKRSKYRAIPVRVDGYYFHSKKEAARWEELKLLQKAGKIKHLDKPQVRVPLFGAKLVIGGQPCSCVPVHIGDWIADFRYIEDGKIIYEDCKSPVSRTAVYRLKKKLAELQGITIRET